jgi:hypothetical protein
MYFLGWYSGPFESEKIYDDLNNAGFVQMAMKGIGGHDNTNSWKLAGSTGGPSGPAVLTCNIDTEWECYYEDFGALCGECWWTTFKDSIGQAVVQMLDNFCIDQSIVWSIGASKGGMF